MPFVFHPDDNGRRPDFVQRKFRDLMCAVIVEKEKLKISHKYIQTYLSLVSCKS